MDGPPPIPPARPTGDSLMTGAKTLIIRRATSDDADQVAAMVAALATSYEFSRRAFAEAYPHLIEAPDTAVLIALDGAKPTGYLLGFRHLTFFANGPVAAVEEIYVDPDHRRSGTGRSLMLAFEQWAASTTCVQVALATRRAAPFYRALGYAESAAYFVKAI